MKTILFTCHGHNGPAYGCDQPNDQSGHYVLASEVEKLLEGAKIACALARIKYGNLDEDVDKELTRIETLCRELS